MKEPCLSVKQPYAWAIVTGLKDIENRSWRTNYRGILAIHASSRFADAEGIDEVRRRAAEAGIEMPQVELLPRQGVVGIVEVTSIVLPQETNSAWADPSADACWVLQNARETEFRPLRGRPGIFDAKEPGLRRALKTSECLNQLAG